MIDIRQRRLSSHGAGTNLPYHQPTQLDIRVEFDSSADRFMQVLNTVLRTMGMQVEKIYEPIDQKYAIYRYKRAK